MPDALQSRKSANEARSSVMNFKLKVVLFTFLFLGLLFLPIVILWQPISVEEELGLVLWSLIINFYSLENWFTASLALALAVVLPLLLWKFFQYRSLLRDASVLQEGCKTTLQKIGKETLSTLLTEAKRSLGDVDPDARDRKTKSDRRDAQSLVRAIQVAMRLAGFQEHRPRMVRIDD